MIERLPQTVREAIRDALPLVDCVRLRDDERAAVRILIEHAQETGVPSRRLLRGDDSDV